MLLLRLQVNLLFLFPCFFSSVIFRSSWQKAQGDNRCLAERFNPFHATGLFLYPHEKKTSGFLMISVLMLTELDALLKVPICIFFEFFPENIFLRQVKLYS